MLSLIKEIANEWNRANLNGQIQRICATADEEAQIYTIFEDNLDGGSLYDRVLCLADAGKKRRIDDPLGRAGIVSIYENE